MAKKKLTLEDMLVPVDEIPYEVPENWCWTRLKYIGSLVTGNTPSKNNKDLYGNDIAFIKPTDLNQGRNLNSSTEYLSTLGGEKARLLPKGSTAVCCIGATIGKVAYLNIKGATNQQINTIVPNKKAINDLFVYYYTLSNQFQSDLIENSSSTTLPIINKSRMEKLLIPLPPLAEQERIVNRIESLFDKVDRAAELIDEARDGFEKRRAAILELAFSGELTKKWREENGVSDEWKEKSLKDICKLTSGGTPSRKNENYYNGNIPWIKTGEIRWNEIYDSEEHITEEAIVNSSAKLIPENTVLVAMYGQGLTRGRAAILKKPSTTNQAVCALIPTNEITCEFLYYYFMKNYWKFREAAKGGNQENLSGKVIGNFSIQIPSLKEQIEIVNVLKKLLDKESNVEDITYIEENINIIKKSILAKAFRGELGSNDLNEESSIELLKELIK